MELEVRVWDSEEAFMRNDVGGIEFLQGGIKVYGCATQIGNGWIKDNPMMLYTTLKDAYKTKVFEGDILENTIDSGLFNWLVVFRNGCFGIQNIGVDGYLMDFFPVDGEYFFFNHRVIGNKYDNPELMKGR